MKDKTVIVIIMTVIGFIFGAAFMNIEKNTQIQHLKQKIDAFPESYDYQIETNLNGYTIYEGKRKVPVVKWNESQTFDSIILKDNL
jgi:hypothetical protein